MIGYYYVIYELELGHVWAQIVNYNENENEEPLGRQIMNDNWAFIKRICEYGHLPNRQAPVLRDPFTVVNHKGEIMFELKDTELIAKLTAALLTS